MLTNGGKHSASSTTLLYVSRRKDGRGLKVLYFELLRELHPVESPSAWYSPIKPKPEYVSEPGRPSTVGRTNLWGEP